VALAVLASVALLAPVAVGWGMSRTYTRMEAQPTNEGQEIASPRTWTAFIAEGVIDNERKQFHAEGTLYRDSNGSERWDQGKPDVTYISIKNIPQSLWYEGKRQPDGTWQWQSRPMELPETGWLPPRISENRAGMQADTMTFEGLELRKQISASGRQAWLSPDLNFFTVRVDDDPVTGTRQRYFDIRREEPNAELFAPPATADVETRSDPGGIVRSGRRQ